MIGTGRFAEFITEFLDLYNKEQEDKISWEYWLHKIFDKNYAEFRELINPQKRAAPTQEDIKNIIEGSFAILKAFDPLRGERGSDNGAVQTAGNDSG